MTQRRKCLECGGTMTTRRENLKYDASGLPGITLIGVDVSRCAECGEYEVAIPHIEGLHKAIATILAQKRERLVGAEVRFLRKYLGLAAGDFAAHAGVTPETVSRWEHESTTMGVTAERLLRWMVLTRDPVSHYPLGILKEVAVEGARASKVGMRVEHGGWQPARERELVPA
jgi:putative zinc finger/helix-turn-helix YgiT family protein